MVIFKLSRWSKSIDVTIFILTICIVVLYFSINDTIGEAAMGYHISLPASRFKQENKKIKWWSISNTLIKKLKLRYFSDIPNWKTS